jgi:hypothetical protein
VSRARGDGGQATVELALVLPLVCLLLLAVVQVGVIVHTQLVVVHAAREGARAAAVDPHPAAAELAVVVGAPLDRNGLTVLERDLGDRVEVQVRYRLTADVPLIGALIGHIDLSARAVMRREY